MAANVSTFWKTVGAHDRPELFVAAANSYRQALDDLTNGNRVSYRGTAAELREGVREVVDHLAPDDAVTKATGFKLEKDRSRPTMKQTARFHSAISSDAVWFDGHRRSCCRPSRRGIGDVRSFCL
jgi:hypothetical protein